MLKLTLTYVLFALMGALCALLFSLGAQYILPAKMALTFDGLGTEDAAILVDQLTESHQVKSADISRRTRNGYQPNEEVIISWDTKGIGFDTSEDILSKVSETGHSFTLARSPNVLISPLSILFGLLVFAIGCRWGNTPLNRDRCELN